MGEDRCSSPARVGRRRFARGRGARGRCPTTRVPASTSVSLTMGGGSWGWSAGEGGAVGEGDGEGVVGEEFGVAVVAVDEVVVERSRAVRGCRGRLVRRRVQVWMWWAWHRQAGMSQSPARQPRSRTVRARRWSGVTRRRRRPTSRITDPPRVTIRPMWHSQSSRSSSERGIWVPSPNSLTPGLPVEGVEVDVDLDVGGVTDPGVMVVMGEEELGQGHQGVGVFDRQRADRVSRRGRRWWRAGGRVRGWPRRRG